MKKFYLALLALAAAIAVVPAKADTVFDVSAVITNTPSGPYAGDVILGTFTINTATGQGDAIDLYSPINAFPAITNILGGTCESPNCVVYFDNGFGVFGEMTLGNTVGYTGGTFGGNPPPPAQPINYLDINSVAYGITGDVVAPEPSSLLLLGTGLLGLAFVAFRKAKASGLTF